MILDGYELKGRAKAAACFGERPPFSLQLYILINT
jgi:hypothetical protein